MLQYIEYEEGMEDSLAGNEKTNFTWFTDYYDFHTNQDRLIETIKTEIIRGDYKPKPPQIIRREKKYGVCRHIQIPSPEDALVLQTIVETLWQHSRFLSRQVAAILPKIRDSKVDYIKKVFTDSGRIDSLRIINNLDIIRNTSPISSKIKFYLEHGTGTVKVYPLTKFLIIIDILNNTNLNSSARIELRDRVTTRINDPLYLKEINSIKIL